MPILPYSSMIPLFSSLLYKKRYCLGQTVFIKPWRSSKVFCSLRDSVITECYRIPFFTGFRSYTKFRSYKVSFLQDWKMYLHDPAKLSALIPSPQYDTSDLGSARHIESMFSCKFRQNMKDLLVKASDFSNINMRTQA